MHLAGAFRRNGADSEQIRLKGRPESNVTDDYVDTGAIPASHANQYGWGALELVARYGIVDLVDRAIDGGYMEKWYAGVNWWANRRIRVSAGFGRATFDKAGTTGHTNQYFTRLQWVY